MPPKSIDEVAKASDSPIAFIVDPKSTLTPAFCGALTWVIAKTVGGVFGFGDLVVGFLALFISACFAAIVVAQVKARLWQRGVFWILNSLIILTMGVGGNTIASIDTARESERPHAETSAPPPPTTRSPAPTPVPPAGTQPRGEKPTVENHTRQAIKEVGRILIRKPF